MWARKASMNSLETADSRRCALVRIETRMSIVGSNGRITRPRLMKSTAESGSTKAIPASCATRLQAMPDSGVVTTTSDPTTAGIAAAWDGKIDDSASAIKRSSARSLAPTLRRRASRCNSGTTSMAFDSSGSISNPAALAEQPQTQSPPDPTQRLRQQDKRACREDTRWPRIVRQ